MSDTLQIFGREFTNVAGFKATDNNGNVLTYVRGDGGITPTGTINITSNGTHDVTNYASANVNVPSSAPSLQSKTNINPTTSSQTITADSGYDGLSSVQINAMPSGSATTPATTITANPSISVGSDGKITATASASQNVTPTVSAGYVSAGTAGTITVSGSATEQLTTQAAKTVTPTETEQTAVASGVYTTGVVKVGAIPSTYALVKDYSIKIVIGSSFGNTIEITGSVSRTSMDTGKQYFANENDSIRVRAIDGGTIYYNNVQVANSTNTVSYDFTMPACNLEISNSDSASNDIYINESRVTNNQNKTVSPTESIQNVQADSGYTGLGTVTVGSISSTYVGSGIARCTWDDLTVSGATVNVPMGYYASTATKSVSTMTLPTSASSSATSGYTSKATIGRSTSNQYINIPAGYNSAGGYYTISAVANGSVETPSASKGSVNNHSITVTPSVTNTTGYVEGGTKYGTGVTVTASELVSGSQTITENGTVDVTNLASVNVALTYSTVKISSSSPSGGNDGDIWIKQ